MKTLFLTLLLSISTLLNAQSRYKAFTSEMYIYDSDKEEWILYQKNSDVDIDVIVEEQFITFFAKTPTMFKIDLGTKEKLSIGNSEGYRYSALDLRKDATVIIDILVSSDLSKTMISITNKYKKYNLRYFLNTKE